MDSKAIAARIEALIDMRRHDQLAVYVGHMEDEDGYRITYDAASLLPLERLEELFLADDWGGAWERFDYESSEGFEQDTGAIMAYREVLAMLELVEVMEG